MIDCRWKNAIQLLKLKFFANLLDSLFQYYPSTQVCYGYKCVKCNNNEVKLNCIVAVVIVDESSCFAENCMSLVDLTQRISVQSFVASDDIGRSVSRVSTACMVELTVV